MKLAVAQVKVSTEKIDNIQKAEQLVQEAIQNGADLLLLPEAFMVYIPASSHLNVADLAEPLGGFFVKAIAELARRYQIYIVFGMLETSGEIERVYNTIVMIDRMGSVIHHYQKTHLYDAFAMHESKRIIPSNNAITPVKTEFGMIGLAVCYEVRFPEIIRTLVIKGADIILMPAAWVAGPDKEMHLQVISQTRALENTVFLAVSDHVGNIFTGRSIIYNPLGKVLATIGQKEGIIYSEIDLKEIKRVRKQLPCIEQRRSNLYEL